ncbi:hypothetical protein MZM54_03500 [[Brevibacterium] frigoritolerans]|nr:hypothetical protein [Peribacillus frigoritolerans]
MEKEIDKIVQNQLVKSLDEFGIGYIPFNLIFQDRLIFINQLNKLRPNIDSVDGGHLLYFYDKKSVNIEKYREAFEKAGRRKNMSDGQLLGVLKDIREMAIERNCLESEIIEEVFS